MNATTAATGPTDASLYLRQMAERIAAEYVARTGARAVLLTGSAAEDCSDFYSDMDVILYHDALPPDDALRAAREAVGAADVKLLGDRDRGSVAEFYRVAGVECQLAHTTVAAWERDMASVLEGLDVDSPLQKAFGGVLDGVPLHGEDLIRCWQARLADYPEPLARAMVERHLTFFPVWTLLPRLETRDATLWLFQSLVEAEQNLLAVLAGLNRLYFSAFQFKRLRRFAARMRIAPADLAERLDAVLLRSATSESAAALERLVGETLSLVEEHMPQIDTAAARSRLGGPAAPWRPA